MIQLNDSFPEGRLSDHESEFQPGQIVRHKRYGYRGVIVSVDGYCRATPQWYLTNQTQPDRDQPWYHVLIDNGENTSYPAEQNLRLDRDPAPVEHPLISVFFSGFENGRHIRNDVPWPH